MCMQVCRHSCTGRFALIDPIVDPIGIQSLLHEGCRMLDQCPEGSPLIGIVVKQRWLAIAKRDKQMTIGIWVAVQQHHSMRVAVNDQVVPVLLGR